MAQTDQEKIEAARIELARRELARRNAPPPEQESSGVPLFAQGAIGAGEAALSALTAIPANVAAGAFGGVTAALAGNDAGAETVRGTQELFTFQPRTEVGKNLIGRVGQTFETARQGLRDFITSPEGPTPETQDNPFAVRTSPSGGLGIESPAVATALETGIEATTLLAGARRTKIPASRLRTPQQVAKQAADNGIIITPGEQSKSVAGLAEGVVGRARTRQIAANKNIPTYNRLANRTLGRLDDAPITPDDLAIYRRDQGGAYSVIDDFGDMGLDTKFRQGLNRAVGDVRQAVRDVPSLATPEVRQLLNVVDDLTAQRTVGRAFNSQSLRGVLARLRAATDDAFKNGNTDLALAYKDVAKNLEDAIERNLQGAGNLTALEEFRAARQNIAKSYSVQEALVADDIINPASLASQKKRGTPLNDELLLIARVHEQFPQSTAITPVTRGNPLPISGTDALTSLAGVAAGQPALAVAPVAAGGLRGFLASPRGAGLVAPFDTQLPGLLGLSEFARQDKL